MDEKTPIVPPASADTNKSQTIYYGAGQSPAQRRGQIIFITIVIISTLICLSLCIYKGVKKAAYDMAFLYFMFAAVLIGLTAIHILTVVFIRRGSISHEKLWFTYVSAFLVFVQSVFIDVLIFYK